MQINGKLSKHTEAASILSRLELKAVLAVADDWEKNAPNNVRLSDEFRLSESTFRFAWISKRENAVLDAELASNVDAGILEGMTSCVTRRVEARAANRAIPELPADARQLALNKAIYEASARGLAVYRDAAPMRDPVAIEARDPRAVLIVRPREEPLVVAGDFLVSGSNVVGGPRQLQLLEETLVVVTYFLHDAPYSQSRANVPLGLAMVKNLVTRIRGEFIRNHPDDTYLTAVAQPDFYVRTRGTPAEEMATLE
jgi:hypothetical protein